MLTRVAVIMTLVALLNNIVGCTVVSKISLDEVKSRPETKIAAVVLPETITGIRLHSGEEMLFDGEGGHYEEYARAISGSTGDSAAVKANLEEISQVQLRRSGINGPRKIIANIESFETDAMMRQWKTIDGVSIRAGGIVKFIGESGRYDADRNSITGLSRNGDTVKFNCDELFQIQARQTSGSRVITFAALGAGLVVLLMIISVQSLGGVDYSGM